MIRKDWKEGIRSVGAGKACCKRVVCRPVHVVRWSYRAENEISGGTATKRRSLLMYHKRSNYSDWNNPGKVNGKGRGDE